ncbi:MAG: hypothetical protein GY939_28400 [Actinomycetia bacterium]|nr:hypothetical protein [Actinomycetes bacterium]
MRQRPILLVVRGSTDEASSVTVDDLDQLGPRLSDRVETTVTSPNRLIIAALLVGGIGVLSC